jgi:hypothetical protein
VKFREGWTHRGARLALAALAGALAYVLFAVAPASADRGLEVSVSDDQALLGTPVPSIDNILTTLSSIGVDRVVVSAYWRDHAPDPLGATRPAGFDAADPAAPGYDWTSLDRVVLGASQRNLKVRIVITTPAPLWGTSEPSRGNPVWRPRPAAFAAFAHAVAQRYREFADQFSVMNEPNQNTWLQPQYDRQGRPFSPRLYRRMAAAASREIRRAAPNARVLIGELSSRGSSAHHRLSPMRPLAFLRAMACVNRRYRPVRSGGCSHFEPVRADTLAMHPYAFGVAPDRHSRNRDDVKIGDTRRLLRALDRLTARRRLLPRHGHHLPVRFTEFGYKTDPPDTKEGIPLRRQARYLELAAYMAWRNPRVDEINQFRIIDGAIEHIPGRNEFREFQTGLWFRTIRPKPALFGFVAPFVITRRGSRMTLWGQVRPGRSHSVVIERARHSRGPWRAIAHARTDARGFFQRRLRRRRGYFRFAYSGFGPRVAAPGFIELPTVSDALRVSG